MTRREARKKLGGRVSRRVGTKTKVIPGGNNTKKAPKYKVRRAALGKKSNAAKVREFLKQDSIALALKNAERRHTE